jgi:hypothetical protein
VVAFFNLRCTDGRLLGTAPKVNVAGDAPETLSLKRLDLLFETKHFQIKKNESQGVEDHDEDVFTQAYG